MTSVSGEAWFSDPALVRVLALLNGDGGEGRVAGGAVRNSLMGLPVSDMDIATTLLPERVQALAEAVQASLARRDATQLGQTVGDRTLLDRLNAENDASTAQLALAQARVALLLDHLRLAALAGRLDEAVLTAANQSLESPPSHSTP